MLLSQVLTFLIYLTLQANVTINVTGDMFFTEIKYDILRLDYLVDEDGFYRTIQIIATFALSMIAFLVMTEYVWFDRCKPYALERDIFMLPGYRPLHTAVDQMLNRKYVDAKERLVEDLSYIFICTTLWHETPLEMETLLKSLVRLIRHVKRKENPSYEFEINIFFDNTFDERNSAEHTEEEAHLPNIQRWKVLNPYVNDFLYVFNKVLSEHHVANTFDDGQVFTTPYGGRLVYSIEGVQFIVHLKDASQVQRGKRWSQVMYLYYLLGWKMDTCKMENSKGQRIQKETTYILALDGDVKFEPYDFELVLTRLDRNRGVAACCNQIHPVGSGPLVWFQRFEYAIGHWFQKSAEHALGCVLCSPGCFSLVRVEYLKRTNVMALYKSLPKTPMEKLMYDQGEDRWLCTLILLSGGRIEYEAGSHCETFAPEDFATYYNQRRRWGPSTAVNILQLIRQSEEAVNKNPYISRAYIVYQSLLLALTTVNISTTLLVMWEALEVGLSGQISSGSAAAIIFLPVVIYIFICYKCTQKTQITAALLLSVLACIIMVVLTVTIAVGAGNCPLNLSLIFLIAMMLIHVLGGILHFDIGSLACGIIYWLLIPSFFIFLQIFMLANLNETSWGTRAGAKPAQVKKKSLVDRVKDIFDGGDKTITCRDAMKAFCCQEAVPVNEPSVIEAAHPNSEFVSEFEEEIKAEMDRQSSSDLLESDSESGFIEFDEKSHALRLRSSHTDTEQYSQFAIYGGFSIRQIRTKRKHQNAFVEKSRSRARRASLGPSLTCKIPSSQRNNYKRITQLASLAHVDTVNQIYPIFMKALNPNGIKPLVYSWLPRSNGYLAHKILI